MAKDMGKSVSILQEGGPTPVLPTPPVIRAVLLHKQRERVILKLYVSLRFKKGYFKVIVIPMYVILMKFF